MKKAIFIMSSLLFFKVLAHAQNFKEPIYYFIDTAKIPANENLWRIDTDLPYKYFIIQCPCMPSSGKAALVYDIANNYKIINKDEFNKLKLMTLPQLIATAKAILSQSLNSEVPNMFLIEPKEDKFIIHQVKLNNVEKNSGLTDYEIIKKH